MYVIAQVKEKERETEGVYNVGGAVAFPLLVAVVMGGEVRGA